MPNGYSPSQLAVPGFSQPQTNKPLTYESSESLQPQIRYRVSNVQRSRYWGKLRNGQEMKYSSPTLAINEMIKAIYYHIDREIKYDEIHNSWEIQSFQEKHKEELLVIKQGLIEKYPGIFTGPQGSPLIGKKWRPSYIAAQPIYCTIPRLVLVSWVRSSRTKPKRFALSIFTTNLPREITLSTFVNGPDSNTRTNKRYLGTEQNPFLPPFQYFFQRSSGGCEAISMRVGYSVSELAWEGRSKHCGPKSLIIKETEMNLDVDTSPGKNRQRQLERQAEIEWRRGVWGMDKMDSGDLNIILTGGFKEEHITPGRLLKSEGIEMKSDEIDVIMKTEDEGIDIDSQLGCESERSEMSSQVEKPPGEEEYLTSDSEPEESMFIPPSLNPNFNPPGFSTQDSPSSSKPQVTAKSRHSSTPKPTFEDLANLRTASYLAFENTRLLQRAEAAERNLHFTTRKYEQLQVSHCQNLGILGPGEIVLDQFVTCLEDEMDLPSANIADRKTRITRIYKEVRDLREQIKALEARNLLLEREYRLGRNEGKDAGFWCKEDFPGFRERKRARTE
ncbi:hypothetical protein NEOLI_002343 [Neolecta irregularis DAH-3]|uniref:Uncharacterized protein n=1 Tax=Neolecta irregularis (strain DAH-3) TaxID=1198029 RepID=A0A1U7LG94_NEOID|nr:hypothetical protein NEOLI_002343 [Neolecta irregularis DAH-3]|eukprot:OLL21667.1 hypothetical protein NEOLI_002343 [Neolecta irregularis DAH-3]